ncbi:hypothetical protein [Kitasatospora sp. NPDC097643]|uniref:hypothetical protein n=1 Tax=Kitasatospora sp. NPDC097643 TaxID=3157230 RepID=UPI00332D343F
MTDRRSARGRAIPVPHPPDVQDWAQLITALTAELDLQGRALQNRAATAGNPVGKSTWHRILSGHTLPSAPVLDLMIASGRFTEEQCRRLLAAWRKAADCLDRADASGRTARGQRTAGSTGTAPALLPAGSGDTAERPSVSPRRTVRTIRTGRTGRIAGVVSAAAACALLGLHLTGGADPVPAEESGDAAPTTTARPAGRQLPPPSTTSTSASTSTERPGIEKGTLGEDSRCSGPFPGPEGVTWRVCTRVEADRISFALKLTNRGIVPTTAKVHLEYAHASTFRPCPTASTAHVVGIGAGATVITPQSDCTIPREPTRASYQGVGRVVAADATDASYELSPTANVYPDRATIWKPDLLA